MRLHARLPALVALAGLLFGLASCQELAGSGHGKAEFIQARTQLADSREALRRAIGEGNLTRVGALMPAVSTRLDEIEKRSSSMNMIDRQRASLHVATARRTITESERWIAAGDLEAVRIKVNQLDTSLGEIDTILDRTIRGATEESGAS